MSTPEKTMFTIWQRQHLDGMVHVFATSTENTYLFASPASRLGEVLALDPESAVKEWHVQQDAKPKTWVVEAHDAGGEECFLADFAILKLTRGFLRRVESYAGKLQEVLEAAMRDPLCQSRVRLSMAFYAPAEHARWTAEHAQWGAWVEQGSWEIEVRSNTFERALSYVSPDKNYRTAQVDIGALVRRFEAQADVAVEVYAREGMLEPLQQDLHFALINEKLDSAYRTIVEKAHAAATLQLASEHTPAETQAG